jgi:hypothetical protein
MGYMPTSSRHDRALSVISAPQAPSGSAVRGRSRSSVSSHTVLELVGGLDWQVKAVGWGRWQKPSEIDGTLVIWSAKLAERIAEPGPLDEGTVQRAATLLADVFWPSETLCCSHGADREERSRFRPACATAERLHLAGTNPSSCHAGELAQTHTAYK